MLLIIQATKEVRPSLGDFGCHEFPERQMDYLYRRSRGIRTPNNSAEREECNPEIIHVHVEQRCQTLGIQRFEKV
jgi:hypothetical protein